MLEGRPTTHDEDWRYADPAALEALVPADLDSWHDTVIAPGETRAKDLVLDAGHPGVHRVRIDVGAGARAELFAVLSAPAYTRLEVEVRRPGAVGAQRRVDVLEAGEVAPDGYEVELLLVLDLVARDRLAVRTRHGERDRNLLTGRRGG